VELYLHSPNMPSWRSAQLRKHRDNFTFAKLILPIVLYGCDLSHEGKKIRVFGTSLMTKILNEVSSPCS
jgi:hypothetical protein